MSEPMACPTCGSDDISYYDIFEDGTMNVRCESVDCGSLWFEMWQFVAYEMSDGEDNRAHEGADK